MVQLGDKVRYFPGDGRFEVEAEVTNYQGEAGNESISIRYPHPNGNAAAAGVQATADGVMRGSGSYQFLEYGEDGPSAPATDGSDPEKEALQTRVDVAEKIASDAQAELAAEKAAHAETQAELDAATAELAALTVTAADKVADKGKDKK